MPESINIITRESVAPSLVPDKEVLEIIKMTPAQSIMMSHARHVTMSSKRHKQPVLNTLPEAYWVDGDNGLKATSKAEWGDLSITAEEMAVIVPIPDAVVEDSKINIWGEVRPLIAEAIGKKLHLASLEFQTLDGIAEAIGIEPCKLCTYCWNGKE